MIELPYPPKELSPNSGQKMHYMKKARITKNYRELIAWNMKAKLLDGNEDYPTNFKITFYPRSSLADKDNAIASFKAGQDGMQDALGINDREFNIEYELGRPVKGGKVVVEIIDGN